MRVPVVAERDRIAARAPNDSILTYIHHHLRDGLVTYPGTPGHT